MIFASSEREQPGLSSRIVRNVRCAPVVLVLVATLARANNTASSTCEPAQSDRLRSC